MNTIYQTENSNNDNTWLSDYPSRLIKTNSNSLLTSEAQMLLDYYQSFLRTDSNLNEPKIKVGETLSMLAVAYERVRNAVDYKGEHLLRRNAIERILRRRLWENPALARDTGKLADTLIKELVWARYLKNNTVPKSKSVEVNKVLEKYLKLSILLSDKYKNHKQSRYLNNWFLEVVSAEIEEILDPTLLKVDVLGLAISSWLSKKFVWENTELNDEEKNIQLNIAIHRGLFKSDQARVRYHLLKHFYPGWGNLSENDMESETQRLVSISQDIEHQLSSPYQPKLYRIVQKQIIQFQIITEIIEQNPEEARRVLSNPNELMTRITKLCEHKYSEINKRVSRGIVRSIIYIFATKVILAFIIEIPFEHIFLGGIKFVPIGINLLVPILFMLLVALTIKKPGKEDTVEITKRVNDFVYNSVDSEQVSFSISLKGQNTSKNKIFWVLYGLLFLFIFGAISYVLFVLSFSIVSGLIFFIFLSLVLLFSFRVRFSASELIVTEKNDGFFSHILTYLSLPLLNLGVWMSSQLSRINLLNVILDFLIEAPLKSILGVFQEWTSFIKERREEVIEVPVN